tara:strand:- start:314 stop:643 length:330 start_codon:yes stop_codon:yes gene_type:complete
MTYSLPFAPNGSEMMQMQIHINVVVKGAFDTGLIKNENDLFKWTEIATNNFGQSMTILPTELSDIYKFTQELIDAKDYQSKLKIMHKYKEKFNSDKAKEIARTIAEDNK